MDSAFETLKELAGKATQNASVKEKTKDWNKVFQFRPTDSEPFYLAIKGGEVNVEKGTAPNAVATIVMSAGDMVQLFRGQLDAIQAFFSGKLKVEGNIFEAQSLQSLIEASK
ncbi:MAG: SCP2 sterol-binding domain-containing protein [Thermoprotei archaeon]